MPVVRHKGCKARSMGVDWSSGDLGWAEHHCTQMGWDFVGKGSLIVVGFLNLNHLARQQTMPRLADCVSSPPRKLSGRIWTPPYQTMA
jgi:hypothetical protein